MNVASLERCKELYELSGWEETLLYWKGKTGKIGALVIREYRSGKLDTTSSLPADDLGYLVRILPELVTTDYYSDFAGLKKSSGQYLAYYSFAERQVASTPEDAACKLAIELLKQGILAAA